MTGAFTFSEDKNAQRPSMLNHEPQNLKKFNGFSWISTIIRTGKPKKNKFLPNKEELEKNQQLPPSSNANRGFTFACEQQGNEEYFGYTTGSNCSHEKDIVPLRQFLRYSVDHSDRRAFQRRRITQPFQPKYEIEWQENQWLQLDDSTSKEIERLRKSGFSKVAIRRDTNLKKYIAYDNASEIDVLLEVSLHKTFVVNKAECKSQPISCHQPILFCVRRTHWWRESYNVGEARLPDWVDSDLCCDPVMTDTFSAKKPMTNGSNMALPSPDDKNTTTIFPDTPTPSQRSSVNILSSSSSSWSIKHLQYTGPPSLLKEHALFYSDAKKAQ